jgi:hypothetical protein
MFSQNMVLAGKEDLQGVRDTCIHIYYKMS